jgi:tRNA(Ile)-lysidine synthase
VIGVSGGPDSLALAFLLREWKLRNNEETIEIKAIIVDHGIREESEQESLEVSNILTKHEIPNEIRKVEWEGDEGLPTSKKQLKCRKKRLEIFEQESIKYENAVVFFAHHLDDQIETILYRFAYQSGIVGLAGISFLQTFHQNATFIRPLLDYQKDTLKATCIRLNQKWVEDPSNEEASTHRGRIRKFLPKWYEAGISKDAMRKIGLHFKKHRLVLNNILEDYFDKYVTYDYRFGYAVIKRYSLDSIPDEILLKVLYNILCHLRNSVDKISELKIANALQNIRNTTKNQKRSIGGFHIINHNNLLYIVREYQTNETHKIKFGEKILWDERFNMKVEQYNKSLPQEERLERLVNNEKKYRALFGARYKKEMFENTKIPDYNGLVDTDPELEMTVRCMKQKDWIELARLNRDMVSKLKAIPHFIKFTLPVVVDKKGLLAIPVLGYKRQNDVHIHWKFEQKLHKIPSLDSFF